MDFIEISDWKTSGAQSGCLLRKAVSTAVEQAGERRIKFVVSTGDPDRDRDCINPAGWKLENFRRNPVVLWAHSYRDLPVAKAVDVRIVGNTLVSIAEFPPADVYEFGDQVYRHLKAGLLNATSVGFRPIRYVFNEERRGYDFEECELLEYSVVPVPANADALAVTRGVDPDALRKWLGDSPEPEIIVADEGLSEDEVQQILRETLPGAVDRAIGRELEALTGKLFDPAPIGGDEEITVDLSPEEIRGAVREATDGVLRRTMIELTGRLD